MDRPGLEFPGFVMMAGWVCHHEQAMLSGPVAIRRGASGTMVPEDAIYRVLLRGSNAEETSSRIVGRVVIKAPTRSFADIVYRKFVALVLRESSV